MAGTDVTKIVLDDGQYKAAAGRVVDANEKIAESAGKAKKATADVGAGGVDSLGKLKAAAGDLPGPLGEAAGSVDKLSKALFANPAVAVGAGVVALGAGMLTMAANAAESTDKIAKLSEATGASAQSLSRYQQLAEKALPSGDISKIAETFQKLALTQRDAAAGSETAQAKLDALRISGDSAEELFNSLAAGAAEMGNTQERSAALTALLGDGLARELAPALALGTDGINALTDENDRFGRTIDANALKITGEYKDAQQELGGATAGLAQEFITLTPILTTAYDVMRGGVETVTSLVRGVKAAGDGIGYFAAVLGSWAGTSKTWDEAADEVAAGLQADADAADRGAEAAAKLAAAEKDAAPVRVEAHKQAAKGITDAERAAEEERKAIAKAGEEYRTQVARREDERRRASIQAQVDEARQLQQEYADFVGALNDEITADIQASVDAQVATLRQAADDEAAIRAATKAVAVDLLNQTFEFAAALVDTFAKDNEKAAKAAFAIQQLSAAASIIVNTAAGVAQALTLPPPADVAVGVARAALGALALGTVLATTFGSTSPFRMSGGGGTGSAGGVGTYKSSSDPADSASAGGSSTNDKAGNKGKSTGPDESYNDTPGVVTARRGFDTFRFAPGDKVIAAQSAADLQRMAAQALGLNPLVEELGRGRGSQDRLIRALEALITGGSSAAYPVPMRAVR